MLARILTSLSSSGQSWQLSAGSPWEKAGVTRARGPRAQPMPAWFCSRFKCDITEPLLGTHGEELPLRPLALKHSTKLVLGFSCLTPREYMKVVTASL